MKNFDAEPTAEERELIETLIAYPSLESAFNRSSPGGFAEIRQKLQATVVNLERVVRRGEKADAERASIAASAYRTAIDFLVELEKIGKARPR
jgi:hypothetical protein